MLQTELPSKYLWFNWENTELRNEAVWIKEGEVWFSPAHLKVTSELMESQDFKSCISEHDQMVLMGELITSHQRTGLPIDGSSTIFAKRQSRNFRKHGRSAEKVIEFFPQMPIACSVFQNS